MLDVQLPILLDSERIADFCKARGIRRLSLFGSVLRKDFDVHVSDVDVLAEFHPEALNALGFEYFEYGDALSQSIDARVDFCSKLNRHVRKAIGSDLVPIYVEA